MLADVNCQVCFYYNAKITRIASLFDRDKHRRRVVSLDLSLSKSIFVAGQAVRGKSSSRDSQGASYFYGNEEY